MYSCKLYVLILVDGFLPSFIKQYAALYEIQYMNYFIYCSMAVNLVYSNPLGFHEQGISEI